MTTVEWKDEFVDGFVRKGIEQGIARGKAEYLLKVLDARGLAVSGQQREQVSSCADPARLDLWFDRALTAASAADVFKD